MTRFVGDAVGVRSGRAKSGISSSQIKKNMEKFLETGVHPDIDRYHSQQKQPYIYPLPDLDINRAHVFFDISIAGKPAGRLVIELYDDLVPVGANHLRNRCLPGAVGSLKNASFHKLLPHYGIFGGRSSAAAQALRISRVDKLMHSEAGAVSISLSGDEVAFTLGRSLPMDETHQVVGRVTKGMDILESFSKISLMPDDSPEEPIRITKCGPTNHKGTHDALDDALVKETAQQTADRLQQESAKARNSVVAALQVGMKRKGEEDAAGSSAQQASSAAVVVAGPAAAKPGAGAGSSRNVKAKLLDSMLGGYSDEDESGSSDGED